MGVMTRRSFIGYCVAGLVVVGGLAETLAGKPVPPPPPPSLPGTVYFLYDTNPQDQGLQANILQMAANGASKGPSPYGAPWQSGEAEPSVKRYGAANRPWWLTSVGTGDPDYAAGIHVTKDGLNLIRIAASGDRDNLDGTVTGLRFGAPVWSNDDQDSCVFAPGYRFQKDLATNTFLWRYRVLYRIDISASDVEGLGTDVIAVTDGDPRLVPLAIYEVPAGVSAAYTEMGDVALAPSPDGNRFVLSFRHPLTSYSDLYLLDVSNGPVLFEAAADLVFEAEPPYVPFRVKWSPPTASTSRVMFQSGGIIRSMNPDGTGIRTITSSGGGWPAWSPDGSHIVYSQMTKKGNTSTYNILRIPSGGGTAVNLTADLEPTFMKLPIAWRP
jgi:hypothetical protein